MDALIAGLYALLGIFGALSVGVFGGGLGVYLVRLGTERRLEGIRIMEWSVRLIIVCFFIIGALRLLEN